MYQHPSTMSVLTLTSILYFLVLSSIIIPRTTEAAVPLERSNCASEKVRLGFDTCVVLSDKYRLYLLYNQQFAQFQTLDNGVSPGQIDFALTLHERAKLDQETSWIGFGLNQHSGMRGADIVIFYRGLDGLWKIEDRFATDNHMDSAPNLDRMQDYNLLRAVSTTEIHQPLEFVFRRYLDTCDTLDYIFTSHVRPFCLWAVGKLHDRATRARNGIDTFPGLYHGPMDRGAAACQIYKFQFGEEGKLPTAAKSYDLKVYNGTFNRGASLIPNPMVQPSGARGTMHYVTSYFSIDTALGQLPQGAALPHRWLLGFKGLPDPTTGHLVRQMQLYRCAKTLPRTNTPNPAFDYKRDNMGNIEQPQQIKVPDSSAGAPFLLPSCANLTYTWAMGDSEYIFEELSGMEVGEHEDLLALHVTYFLPEAEFNSTMSANGGQQPAMATLTTDSSGIRLYYINPNEAQVTKYAENWSVGLKFYEGLQASAFKETKTRTLFAPSECLEDYIEDQKIAINAVKYVGNSHVRRIAAAVQRPELSVFDGGNPTASFKYLSHPWRFDVNSKSFARQYETPLRKFHDSFVLQCEWDFAHHNETMRFSQNAPNMTNTEQCQVEMIVSPSEPGHQLSTFSDYAIPLTHPDEVYGPTLYKGVDLLLTELKRRAANFCNTHCDNVDSIGQYKKKTNLPLQNQDLHAAEAGFSFGGFFNVSNKTREVYAREQRDMCAECTSDYCSPTNPQYYQCMGTVSYIGCRGCKFYGHSNECDGLVYLGFCPTAVSKKTLDYIPGRAERVAKIVEFVETFIQHRETQMCNKYCGIGKHDKTVYMCKDSRKLTFGPSPTQFGGFESYCLNAPLSGERPDQCFAHLNCDAGYYCVDSKVHFPDGLSTSAGRVWRANWCAPCARCCRVGDGVDSSCPPACGCMAAKPGQCQRAFGKMYCAEMEFAYVLQTKTITSLGDELWVNSSMSGKIEPTCENKVTGDLVTGGCPGICPGAADPYAAQWFHYDPGSSVCRPCKNSEASYRVRMQELLTESDLPWDNWTIRDIERLRRLKENELSQGRDLMSCDRAPLLRAFLESIKHLDVKEFHMNSTCPFTFREHACLRNALFQEPSALTTSLTVMYPVFVTDDKERVTLSMNTTVFVETSIPEEKLVEETSEQRMDIQETFRRGFVHAMLESSANELFMPPDGETAAQLGLTKEEVTVKTHLLDQEDASSNPPAAGSMRALSMALSIDVIFQNSTQAYGLIPILSSSQFGIDFGTAARSKIAEVDLERYPVADPVATMAPASDGATEAPTTTRPPVKLADTFAIVQTEVMVPLAVALREIPPVPMSGAWSDRGYLSLTNSLLGILFNVLLFYHIPAG